MINHELETPEPPLDSLIASQELFLGRPPIASTPPRPFVPGERVRVGSGVFAGVEGIVLECWQLDRLLLAVDVQQKGITLEIDSAAIDPIE